MQTLINEPLIQLIKAVGKDEAARQLGLKMADLDETILKLSYTHDFEMFAKDQLHIINKLGQLVRFKLNRGQRKIKASIDKQRAAGKPVRICLLKARQFGGTTLFQGYISRDTFLRGSRNSLVIAHSLESAEHIRSMSERYYKMLDMKVPTPKKKTEKWWLFPHRDEGKPVESSLRIDTAENLGAGHSFTIQNLHASEIQRWNKPEEIVKGLFPSIPKGSPDTMVFMEGTGSGVGDYWYDFCQMAMSGETEWEFVFVPWYEIEDYLTPLTDEEREKFLQTVGSYKIRGGEIDKEEELLLKQGLTAEQLYWRRNEINSVYKGDIDSFHQQYPASPDEAFLTSGRPVFPSMLVKQRMLESQPPIKKGFIRKKEKSVVFDEDHFGYWEIFKEPVSGTMNKYVVGIDISEGIEVIPGLGNRGGDYSVIRVFDRETREFVAKMRARIDNDMLAQEAYYASEYYGGREVVALFPEQNAGGGGNVVIHELKDKYPVRMIKTPSFGKKRLEIKEEYGWETKGGKLQSTKRMMIDELNAQIRDAEFVDLDKDFWVECSTYVRDEKGSTNAQSGKFDDIVMATAITLQGDRLMGETWKKVKIEPKRIAKDVDRGLEWNDESRFDSTVTREKVMEEMYV